MDLKIFEPLFEKKIDQPSADPAHDLLHFKRVVTTAKKICKAEGGRQNIVVPAAWLHDLVVIPKNDPRRKQASRLSALAAEEFLGSISYPREWIPEIMHAIEAHSFSANIEPTTLDAQIVQDADRLDALGAIGIARCFATAGLLGRPFYSGQDPFCENRAPDDSRYTLDHFYQKLFKIAETFRTETGRALAQKRISGMKDFLSNLQSEL